MTKTNNERTKMTVAEKATKAIKMQDFHTDERKGMLTKITEGMPKVMVLTKAFFETTELKFMRREREIEQGIWVTRNVPVIGPVSVGKVLISINKIESISKDVVVEKEIRTWVTETEHGLETVYVDKDAEPDGDVGDSEGNLTSRLKLLKAAAYAWNNGDFELYNTIIMNLGIRGEMRNYMFKNRYEATDHDFNIDYYRTRFGENDRFDNMRSQLKKAHMNALYPTVLGKSGQQVQASNWLFNADWDRDDRPMKDWDGGDGNVLEDPSTLTPAEAYKRQRANEAGSAGFAYTTKHKGVEPKHSVSPEEVEVMSAWSIPLAPIKAGDESEEYIDILSDKGMLYMDREAVYQVYPVMIMGGYAEYYPNDVWKAMMPFRSASEEETAKETFLNHKDGQEKFSEQDSVVGAVKRGVYDTSPNRAEDIKLELTNKSFPELRAIASKVGITGRSADNIIEKMVEYLTK